MATILDVGFLEYFAPVFVLLLVFVIGYGVLAKTKPFGESQVLYAALAFVLGIFVLLFPPITNFISVLAPYFTAYALLIFFVLFLFLIFGLKMDVFAGKDVLGTPLVHWTIIVGAIFILIFVFSQVWGDDLAPGEEAEEDLNVRVRDILFNPTLLGTVFLLVIAAFAIRFLTLKDKI